MGRCSVSAHTPGPWKVSNVGGVRTIKSAIQAGYFAEVRGACKGAHGAEGDANAALIASAPELLEALRAMVAAQALTPGDCYGPDGMPNKNHGATTRALKVACTAIARAEGKVRP